MGMTEDMNTVLLVEDNPDYALLIGQCLEEAGYRVTTTRTGVDALSIMDSKKHNLIVLDYSLPGENGLDVLGEMRSREDKIPVIMVTTQGSEQLAVSAMKSGTYDYVVKGRDYLQRLPVVAQRAIEAQELATERGQAEEAVRELLGKIERAKQEWESTADSLPDLICLVDCHGHIIRANRTVETWKVGRVIDVEGRGFHEILHPGCVDPTCYLDSFWKQALNGMRHPHSDQLEAYDEILERHILVRAHPCRHGEQDRTTGSVVFIMSDITERKRVEQQLQESEKLYRHIFENTTLGVGISSLEGRSIVANGAIQTMTGYSLDELKEIKLGDLYENSESRGELLEILTRHESAIDFPARLRRKDGTLFDSLLNVSLIYLQGKKFLHTICQDVTERKRAEEAQRQLLSMKEEFINNISHELRTPLFSIQGFVALLLQGRVPDPMIRHEFLERVLAQTHRLIQLVNDLLDVSRLEKGWLALEMEEVQIQEAIERIAGQLENMAQEKSIALVAQVESPLPFVEADSRRVEQVLVNLVGNALKFTPNGGKVSVVSRVEGDHVLVQVSDTGLGIPSDAMPHLFGKFYQVDGSVTRRVGGTGLGLYLSKMMVEAHGGQIWVESTPNKGSTFSFTLPFNHQRPKKEEGEVVLHRN